MAAISSRRFTVEADNVSDYAPRSVRRVTLNVDAMKATKLSTGDVVCISNADNSTPGKVGPLYNFPFHARANP